MKKKNTSWFNIQHSVYFLIVSIATQLLLHGNTWCSQIKAELTLFRKKRKKKKPKGCLDFAYIRRSCGIIAVVSKTSYNLFLTILLPTTLNAYFQYFTKLRKYSVSIFVVFPLASSWIFSFLLFSFCNVNVGSVSPSASQGQLHRRPSGKGDTLPEHCSF